MITFEDGVFRLDAESCSYWFRVTAFGHLEHVYWGPRLESQPVDALLLKRTAQTGSSVVYDQSDPLYVLDNIPLEWSGDGYGDYRFSPAELRMPDGGFSHDFIYIGHEISDGTVPMEGLPGAVDPCGTADPGVVDSGGVDPGAADFGGIDSGAVDSGGIDSGGTATAKAKDRLFFASKSV